MPPCVYYEKASSGKADEADDAWHGISLLERIIEKESTHASHAANKSEGTPVVRYDAFVPLSSDVLYSHLIREYSHTSDRETIRQDIGVAERQSNLTLKRAAAEHKNYEISLHYVPERNGFQVSYLSEYAGNIELARQDFRLALDKTLQIFPKSLMGGILGFTYLGSGKIARRDDLFGDMAMLVDVHESIHTPDEYETRILTEWILAIQKPAYKR